MNESDHVEPMPRALIRHEPVGLTDAGGIERAVAHFLERLFEHLRLDNETLNEIEPPPDETERVRILTNKMAPRIFIGSVPWTITGAIPPDALPVYPSIVVATERVSSFYELGSIDIRIFAGTFDQSPDQGGRLDLLTMMETIRAALFQFGEDIGGVTRLASPSQAAKPISYQMARENPLGYFFAEMIAIFDLATPQSFSKDPKWRGLKGGFYG